MNRYRLRAGVRVHLFTVGLALLLLAGTAATGQGSSCIRSRHLFDIDGGDTSFRQPADLAVSNDRLFVLDDLNGRIASFDLSGSFLASTPLPGKGVSYLGFDVGGDDNFYVASPGESKVLVLNSKGKVLRNFATGGDDGLSNPVGIDVSRGVSIVADNGEQRMKVYDLEGKLQAEWGSNGESTGNFRYPFRIVQDNADRIFVTDSLNSRIQVFTPKGELLLVFGEFGVTEGTFFRPAGIATWGEDLLAISDNYLGSVQFFDVKGRYRGVLCDETDQPLLMENPVSLASSGSSLFILEMGAGRVKAFRVQP